MWKKTDSDPQPQPTNTKPAPRPGRAPSGDGAIIGASINIDGDLSGDEDLTIHGRVKGQINLPKHALRIGGDGRVEAKVKARSIQVDGTVQGDLTAEHEIVIRKSGNVRGNLMAPRIGLEEGAKFKGSIDMEPQETSRRHETNKQPRPQQRNSDGASATENKAAG